MFLNLLALSSLAVFLLTAAPQQASALALAEPAPHVVRHHGEVARRKRAAAPSSNKQCKHRPSSAAPKSSPAAVKAKSTASSYKAASTPKAHVSGNTSNGNGGGGGSGNDDDSDNNDNNDSTPNTPSTSVGNSGTKIGMAWPGGNSNNIFNFKGPNAIYTWSPACPSVAGQAGMDCFPMIWGRRDIEQFKQVSATSHSEWFMGFNECNEGGQCNMSPEDAVPIWIDTMTPLKKKGKKLVCPVTSSNPNGLKWVQDFLRICGDQCECDAIALHFYDNTVDKFKNYVELWHSTFPNKPLWITEFGCVNFNGPQQPSSDYVYQFMGEVTRWMDTLDYVDRYFAFGFSPTPGGGTNNNIALMNYQGKPTALGSLYLHH